jgi:5-methylcytosine-specific restriction endonuclease McrA
MTKQKNKQIEKRDGLGRFVKGTIPRHKGIGLPQIREKNHYKWVGGSRATARTMAKRYGFNLNKCISCGTTGNMVVHHVDENFHNNKLDNLRILCYKCHNQLHGTGEETRYKKGHKVSQEIRNKIGRANSK